MRSRYPGTSNIAYSFGPGPLTPAVKALLIANVAIFLLSYAIDALVLQFGLQPAAVFERFAVWQPITYMFLHGGIGHILFNMLSLWMIGVELERMWGTRFFTQYYFVSGIGAAFAQVLLGVLPFEFASDFYFQSTIGASGAIFGLLLAYALYFPNRPILMFLFFPVPAKYFVIIIGALAFLAGPGGEISNAAHLGGLVFGYLYLRGGRGGGLGAELKYRYLKWKINRVRKKFDVYSGGRADDWDRRVH
jgi:membrane associated rhomboid family serine protease